VPPRRHLWLACALLLWGCDDRPPLSVPALETVDAGPTALVCEGPSITVPGKVGGATVGTPHPSCEGASGRFPWANGAAGAPCHSGTDCTPVCCACPTPSTLNALTSWCLDGHCATAEQACCILVGTPTLSCGTEAPAE
jgi:hypothetical protein